MNFQIEEIDFSQLTLPNKLYKYRTWQNPNHKKVITHKEVFFAPYRSFNSKYEHLIEDDYNSIDEEKVWQQIYDDAPKLFDIHEHDKRVKHANKFVEEKNWNKPEIQTEASKKFQDRLNNEFGALCMSEVKDNYTLWSDFTGFSIGLNPAFMFEKGQIQCTSGYVNYYPEDSPPKTKVFTYSKIERAAEVNKVIFNLPFRYKDEKEYRLSKYIVNTGRSFPIKEQTVEEINIGAKMNQKNKSELIAAANNNYPNSKIYEQRLNDRDEIIGYEQIN